MEALKKMAEMIAAGVEVAATLLIAYGALEALYGAVRAIITPRTKTGMRKDIWTASVCGYCSAWNSSWLQTLCPRNCANLDRHRPTCFDRRHLHIPELRSRERS
jgi:hypothetical protein